MGDFPCGTPAWNRQMHFCTYGTDSGTSHCWKYQRNRSLSGSWRSYC